MVAARRRNTPSHFLTALGAIKAKLHGMLIRHKGRNYVVTLGPGGRRVKTLTGTIWASADNVPARSVEELFRGLAVPETLQRKVMETLIGDGTSARPRRRMANKLRAPGRRARTAARDTQAAT